MKRITLISFLTLFWAFTVTVSAQNKSITVYSDDFAGSQATLGVGKYGYMDLVKMGAGLVRSVRVPEGMMVTLFDRDDFQGTSLTLTDDANQRWLAAKGFGDIMVNISIQVSLLPEALASAPYVVIYKDNFSGSSKKLRVGVYDFYELGAVDNDQLSSVKIPPGLKVTLYEDKELGGRSLEVTADASTAFLTKNKFNDVASSIRVEEAPIPEPAVVTIQEPTTEPSETSESQPETEASEEAEIKGAMATIYFANNSKRFTVGRYDFDALGGEDSLQSIRLSQGLRVVLYSEPGFKGKSLTIDEDMVTHSYYEDQKFLRIGSLVVEEIPSVTLYQDGYSGDSATFYLPGYYNTDMLGVNDDDLSSIKISDKFWVLLFEDSDFNGRSVLLTHNGSSDFLAGRGFNNKASSMIIGKSADPLPQVTLYQDDLTGPKLDLTPGKYGLLKFNNSVSSLELPRGMKITLFDEPEFKGKAITLNSSVHADYLASVGFDNVASSAIVEILRPRDFMVTIYADQFSGYSQDLLPGKYRMRDITIGDDAISSIHVPPGMRVTLYEDDNFKGLEEQVDRDTDFSNSRYLNNIFSSLIVEDVFEPVIWNTPVVTTTHAQTVIEDTTSENETQEEAEEISPELSCEMTDKEFYTALKAIEAKPFSEEKMNTARLSTEGKCLTIEQIRAIALQFQYEEQTLDFVEYAYTLAKEKSMYYTLDDVFKFMSSKDAFTKFLQAK